GALRPSPVVAPGSDYACSFTGSVSGDGPDTRTDTVSASADDDDTGGSTASGADSAIVVIDNVAPTANFANNGPVNEGSPVTVTFSSQFDPSSADTTAGFHYSFACTGGAAALATSYASTLSLTSKMCTFDDNGTYTVWGRIFDKDDGSTTYSTVVTVSNVAPTVTAPANQTANEGASTSFSLGSFSDPGVNDSPWAVDVDWGDSTAHSTFNGSTQGGLGSLSHTYADNTTPPATGYTVTVKVTDKD